MDKPLPQLPAMKIAVYLTAAALLVGGASTVVASWAGPAGAKAATVTAIISWLAAMVSLIPIALGRAWGFMGLVWGYFIGSALRVAVGLAGAVMLVRWAGYPVMIVVATLMGSYLVMLALEVWLVGRHLWQFGQGSPADAGRTGNRTEAVA
jgi:hypothetical protein